MLMRPLASLAFSFASKPVYPLAKMAVKIALPGIFAITKRFNSSHAAPLSFMPHAFPIHEAAKRFIDADHKRLLAPRIRYDANQLVVGHDNPMKKALVPFYGVNASIAGTRYKAEYAIDSTEYYTETDDKGNTTLQSRTRRDWYDISGYLRGIRYNPQDNKMGIYAGFTWSAKLLEESMDGYKILRHLQPFEAKAIEQDIHIDPFLKRLAQAQKEAYRRIHNAEKDRIRDDINNRITCDDISISDYTISYNDFDLSAYMLPAYILQYPNLSPRVLPALFENDTQIYGKAPISPFKTMLAAAAATAIPAVLATTVPLPFRLGWMAFSSVASGLYAHYNLSARHTYQTRKLNHEKEDNESVSETLADRFRFEATSRDFKILEPAQILNVDPEFYEVMGLKPDEPVTEEKIQEAFSEKLKAAHPDQGGTSEDTQKLIQAKQAFTTALRKNVDLKSNGGQRSLSTLVRKPIVKQPPQSVRDMRAGVLIETVLDKKNYRDALILVQTGQVHPDGHDAGENTLLTEATKRGDLKAMDFAINTLGASVDTSCDCPDHNTALHYAAGSGRSDTTNMLLKNGANPNLINRRGDTARDVAKKGNHAAVEKLLIEKGGQLHTTLPGSEGKLASLKGRFFGYKARERTLLLDEQNIQYLPAPGKKS